MIRPQLILLAAALALASAAEAQTAYHLAKTSEPFPFDEARTVGTASSPMPSSTRGSGTPPFTSSRVIASGAFPFYPFPYSPVGKVFVEWPDGTFSLCSGVVIAPRILLTAGHCVLQAERGSSGLAQRLLFVPAYLFQSGEFWEASAIVPSFAWAQGRGTLPNGADYALVELADNRFGRVGDAVGRHPFAIRRLFPNHVTILGYPLAYDGGELMHVVTSQSFRRGRGGTVLYPGDMGIGADGSPLIEKFGLASEGQIDGGVNLVVGVTSFSYQEQNGSTLVVSSELGEQFVFHYQLICSLDIDNCKFPKEETLQP